MTDKFLSATIQKQVWNAFKDNQDVIATSLARDVEGNVDKNAAEMLITGMMLSTQIAVQIMIRILEDVGVIETQPDAVAFAQLINDELSKDSEEISE